MQFSNDGATWSPLQTSATIVSWTLAVGDSIKTVSARFVDKAGNVSSIATSSVTVDATAPAGTVDINNGAASTTSRYVTLTLSCTDAASGCSQMQFSDNGTSGWSKLQPSNTSASYTLSNGHRDEDGVRPLRRCRRQRVGERLGQHSEVKARCAARANAPAGR